MIREVALGSLLDIMAYGVGAFSGKNVYWSVGAYWRKYDIFNVKDLN